MGDSGFSPGLPQTSTRKLRFGAFVLDLDRASVSKGEAERKLRPKSFEVLCYLVERPRRLLSKQELISAIWPDSFATDNALVQCAFPRGCEGRRTCGTFSRSHAYTVSRIQKRAVQLSGVNEGRRPCF